MDEFWEIYSALNSPNGFVIHVTRYMCFNKDVLYP